MNIPIIKEKTVLYLEDAQVCVKSNEWDNARHYITMALDEIEWLEEHPERVFIKGEPL